MRLFGFEISRQKFVNKDMDQPENAKIGVRIADRQQIREKQEINKWRSALNLAESKFNPSREYLIKVFADIVLDAHLSALMQTRRLAVQSCEYHIKLNGDENEQISDLLHRDWFQRFIEFAIDSKFYGFSLIELGDITNDGFDGIKLIPRQYVVPEKSVVKTDLATLWTSGIDFTAEPVSDWTIFVGDPDDLGLLNKAAPLVIWKKNVLAAWSVRADMFGIPLRIGKTNIRNEDSRASMEEMMINMSGATWGVFDTTDEIEFKETSSTDAYKIFDEMVNRINSELSKLILGQTGTTDEKSYSGSSAVHERVAEMYAHADKEFIENVINGQLLPRMAKFGLIPEGCEFEFVEKDELKIDEQFKIDSELLKYYSIPAEYITEKYGTPVEPKSDVSNMGAVANAYKDFFDKPDNCC